MTILHLQELCNLLGPLYMACISYRKPIVCFLTHSELFCLSVNECSSFPSYMTVDIHTLPLSSDFRFPIYCSLLWIYLSIVAFQPHSGEKHHPKEHSVMMEMF